MGRTEGTVDLDALDALLFSIFWDGHDEVMVVMRDGLGEIFSFWCVGRLVRWVK